MSYKPERSLTEIVNIFHGYVCFIYDRVPSTQNDIESKKAALLLKINMKW